MSGSGRQTPAGAAASHAGGPAAPRAAVSWRGELAGALNATAAMLPFVLSFGYIAWGALGAAAGRIGLAASVAAVVVGGAAMLLFSRARLPTAAPSVSACLILGGAVLALLRDPALAAGTREATALLLAAAAATVVISGLLLMLFGAFGAGRLVRFVPQAVLAGFMNGVAILIVVSQLPPLLGLPADAWARDGLGSLAGWHGPALAVAAGTALLVALLGWRWPRLPAPLVGLVLVGLAVAAWQAWAPPGAAGHDLQRIGGLEALPLRPDALAPLAAGWPALLPHARTIGVTALLLALIGALESVLALAAVDQQTDDRSDPDRALMALGAANIAAALFGALPLVYLRLRAVATLAGGGRSARSVWLSCALLGVLFTFGLPLLAPLATAVIAGVVVVLAWALVDRWTRELARRWWRGERDPDARWNLAVVALVCGVTLGWGFVAGVAAGVLASLVIFIHALQRSLVRERYSAAAFPSRRVYAQAEEALLAPLRRRIEVLELEGALFFGNAERLLQAGAAVLDAAPLELIVDLRRVSTLDASGALALARLGTVGARRHVTLRLAGVRADDRHGRTLAVHGATLPAYPDLDRAVEAAEQAALAQARPANPARSVPLEDCQLAAGLDAQQIERLRRHLRERRLAAGERLFAEGDAGDALYLLAAGSISVLDAGTAQRFVSFSPGMSFGETALLDRGGRTGDARADVDSCVFELPAASFAEIERDDPALAACIYRNLATHLSQRLRSAAAGWRRAAG